jgi:malate synthase
VQVGEAAYASGEFDAARELFEKVALSDDFDDFLTLPAYDMVASR